MYALRMIEDSPDTVLDDDELNALLERPFTELSVDELMAMKAAYAARGIRIDNGASTEQVVLAFLAGKVSLPFVQALFQTLGQRAANSVADLSKQVTDAVRKHVKRKGRPGDTPLIALPDPMTDEAWLALFEMVEADELHGKKIVRWDSSASAWRPDDD